VLVVYLPLKGNAVLCETDHAYLCFLFAGRAVHHHLSECPKASKTNRTGYFLIRT